MKTRLPAIIASVALIGGLMGASIGVVSAAGPSCTTSCYVDPTGSDSNGGAATDDALLTIQTAVNQVNVGGTVIIAAGIYDEQVVVDAKSLTLQGAGASTIIRPSGPADLTGLYTYPAGTFWPGTVMASIILVKGTSAGTIKGLRVDGVNVTSLPSGASRLAGILFGESAGSIDNVAVTDIVSGGYANRSYGIDLSGTGTARTVEVMNSHISNWSRNGIQAQGGTLTADIHDNVLTGPGDTLVAGAVPNGILFIHGTGGDVTANTITALHTSTSGGSRSAGILFYDPLTPGIVVERNNISDVDDGVNVSHNANDVVVRSNTLHDNLETGVHLEDGATNATIAGNRITGNDLVGIRFAGAGDPTTPDDPPGTGNVAHFNRITGNAIGIADYDTQVFDATNNWWGCNLGPTVAGCDSFYGDVTVDPWLVLRVIAPSSIFEDATSSATADVTHDSSGTDTSPAGTILNGTPIGFSATAGNVGATTAGTTNGQAQVAFTANATPGSGSVSATLDSQTVSTPVLVVALPSPTPSPTPTASPSPTPSPTPAAMPVSESNGTAEGITHTGPFTVSTKILGHRQYVTLRFQSSPALAGVPVGIWISVKDAHGTWSAFQPHTLRIADASGMVNYAYRSNRQAWLSFRAYYAGDEFHASAWSPARQVRWIQ